MTQDEHDECAKCEGFEVGGWRPRADLGPHSCTTYDMQRECTEIDFTALYDMCERELYLTVAIIFQKSFQQCAPARSGTSPLSDNAFYAGMTCIPVHFMRKKTRAPSFIHAHVCILSLFVEDGGTSSPTYEPVAGIARQTTNTVLLPIVRGPMWSSQVCGFSIDPLDPRRSSARGGSCFPAGISGFIPSSRPPEHRMRRCYQ